MLVHCVVKYSRPPDLKSDPQMSASHLLGLQSPQQTPAKKLLYRYFLTQIASGKLTLFEWCLTYEQGNLPILKCTKDDVGKVLIVPQETC